MVRNQMQSQKGLSMTAFIQQYGSEAKRFEGLFKWPWPGGFICWKRTVINNCISIH